MTPTSQASATILDVLEARIQLLLPPIYQQTYKDVSPRSMGSAALRYGADGRVRWNEIWGSFCDLAMAGGPPHRGTLLEPASVQEIALVAAQYNEVVSEVCRGLRLVTGLHVYPAQVPGWVSIDCTSVAMAAWLARAIVMENVAARARALFWRCQPRLLIDWRKRLRT
ncbi:hypothetical protein [Acidipila sp. EB88]|uniref:hypothetical protein n=1 Tax=Acidipila sp. EB88 TaxID=2305226 RepID=UPI000F5D7D13|nr:hypothetical protein [Acidipila sp. EB88]